MTIYLNEHDPKAAEWLRELSRCGAIPPAHVDARSIADVRPNDLRGFDQCHFFAGIGGWPYALQLAGWPVERPVWTGSCPCQPFSAAGKQRGTADERHLWPEFRRLIAECRPPTIFGEQVASKLGREWLAGIRADLEALGYAMLDLVGCTQVELVAHIESQFVGGMAWDNRGEWQIDHIIPCAMFRLSELDERRRCFHFSNLRPLWAKDNLSKSDDLDDTLTEAAFNDIRHRNV